MPMKSRKASKSGVYHVVIRGVNQQQIFEEEDDYRKFMTVLSEVKALSNCTYYAYCLMGNHAHLLLREGTESISTIMRRITVRYVGWFNTKYERTGHLMQGRYRSEPVEDNSYFLAAIRYIHNNPVKAGICSDPKFYPHSSMHEYVKGASLIDDSLAFALLPKERFITMNEIQTNHVFIDVTDDPTKHVTETKAQEIILKYSGCNNATEFQRLNPLEKREAVKKIHSKGVSIRQIVRLCGISKGSVENYLKQ